MVNLTHQAARSLEKQGQFRRPASCFDGYSCAPKQTTMTEGTIAGLNEKGYGFIRREGQEKDLFFHMNELKNISFEELREGDKVSFEVGEGPKGPNAINVSKI
jgi:CspA family cold shock protein